MPEQSGATTASGAVPGRGADKHQRILDAAIEVIAEKGFAQSRVSDIAARAGVADGTIYLYFKNKEQILMAAIDSAFEHFLAQARTELAKTSDPREQLNRLGRLHLETLGSRRSLAVVFQTELRHSAKFLAQFSQHQLVAYFDMIRATVRAGQHAGIFRQDISEKIAANCFFGALDEMVTSWVLSDRDYPLAGAAEIIVKVILRGMESRAVGDEDSKDR